MAAVDHGHAAIRLGDDDRVGARLGHAEHGDEQVRCADAAIAADGDRAAGKRRHELGKRTGRHAHHGLARRVEARRGGEGHADPRSRRGGGADLLERRHGLDPDDVDAAVLQALDLLDEDLDRLVLGQRAERCEEVAGRPDRAGNHHRPPGGIGDGAGVLRGEAVQLAGAILEIVQHQPAAIGAEGIGEDDVGAGIDEALVERTDRVAVRLVPQLRRIARGEAHVEQVRARRPVSEEDWTRGKKRFERCAHGGYGPCRAEYPGPVPGVFRRVWLNVSGVRVRTASPRATARAAGRGVRPAGGRRWCGSRWASGRGGCGSGG